MPTRSRDDAGIVVPLRSFALGKARLAPVLSEAEREALARSMADCVVDAAGGRPVVIVSSAPEVVAWAGRRHLDVVDDPGSLDAAARAGRDWAIHLGLARYAVVHADLPLARTLDPIATDGADPVAVIVPDHRDDGTPVISLPTASPFTFAYGPASAARHAEEARRRSLTVRIVHDAELGFDVDVATDLATLDEIRVASAPRLEPARPGGPGPSRDVTVTVDLDAPRRVLAIGAHADDIEFGCGATLAKWADAGAHVTMCVCTDGSKGTWDGDADLDALISRRADEQRAAASILGAADVVLLGYVDGELESTREATAAVCRVIREARPDVVLGHDPWHPYRIHPDHFHAGMLVTSGIVAARDPHFFAEQGLAPHRPATLLMFEPGRVDHVEHVDAGVDRKIDALLAHRSQWRSTMAIDDRPDEQRHAFAERLRGEARSAGLRAGLHAAEAFARIDHL